MSRAPLAHVPRCYAVDTQVLCTIDRVAHSCTLCLSSDGRRKAGEGFIALTGISTSFNGILIVPLTDVTAMVCEPRGPRRVVTCGVRVSTQREKNTGICKAKACNEGGNHSCHMAILHVDWGAMVASHMSLFYLHYRTLTGHRFHDGSSVIATTHECLRSNRRIIPCTCNDRHMKMPPVSPHP